MSEVRARYSFCPIHILNTPLATFRKRLCVETRGAGYIDHKGQGDRAMQKSFINFSNYTEFLSALHQNRHPVFVVAHRGIWGKAPENSLQAFRNCLEQGVYLIEMDFQKTKDGHLVILHDSSVDRMTNGTGEVSAFTLEEIRSLSLKEGNGGENAPLTHEKIPTFSEVLSLLKGKALINADKSWNYRSALYEHIVKENAFDSVILKSRKPVDEVLEFLHDKEQALQYMHIISNSNIDELDKLLEHCRLSAIEVLFHSEADQVISGDTILKIRNHTNVWCNALDDGENAGHNDSLSLMEPASGWGWLLDRGINIIQTDHAVKVMEYAAIRKAGRS